MTDKDRREDIGSKVMIGLILGGFGTVVGLFFNATWLTANEGRTKADNAIVRVTSVEAKIDGMADDLKEIKALLRRGIPG